MCRGNSLRLKKKQVGQGFIGEQAHGVQMGCKMNGDTRGRAFRPPRTERSARRGDERSRRAGLWRRRAPCAHGSF